jgi:hypothetical protein
LAQLAKLEQNPFSQQIDLCENLIYFTTKQGKLKNEAEDSETPKDPDASNDRQKKIDEAVKQGKIEVSLTKAEK